MNTSFLHEVAILIVFDSQTCVIRMAPPKNQTSKRIGGEGGGEGGGRWEGGRGGRGEGRREIRNLPPETPLATQIFKIFCLTEINKK